MKWEVRTMRSGTSFFDWTVFRKTVFRFWPLWAVYLVGWLFAMPLTGLTMLRLDAGSFNNSGGYLEDFAFYAMPQMVEAALPVAVFFGVLSAMAVFSHLFSARSANLFGSLPIRREGLFLTHYLAGLAFFLVPNVIIFLLTLAVEAAGGCLSVKILLFWLAAVCGEGFFFYSLAVFCAMFTGHVLALPAFYAIVNFFVEGVTALVVVVLEAFYYGFAGVPYWVETIVKWFTPTAQFSSVQVNWVYSDALPYPSTEADFFNVKNRIYFLENGGTLAVYAAAALALAVCAFFLYRARRLESAGDVVAVNAMKPVFRYGVALCAGLALGMGTMVILYGGEIGLMIAIVVWGVIGYFAAEMLLQKSFKVFGKWKGAVAVTAVFAALFCVVGFDLTGFETRIPDPSDVESVYVRGLEVMYLGDDGDRLDLNITDPDAIRLITLVHKAAVDQRNVNQTEYGSITSLYVTYRLKNGGTLSRQYYNIWVRPAEAEQEGTASWAVQQLYNDRELCWRMYGFDALEDLLAQGGRLDQVEHRYCDDGWNWTNAFYYGDAADALLAAVKEDFFAGRIGARWVTEDRWEYRGTEAGLIFSAYKQESGDYKYQYVTITVSDTASGTLAALEDLADQAVVPDRPDTDYPDGIIDEQPVG